MMSVVWGEEDDFQRREKKRCRESCVAALKILTEEASGTQHQRRSQGSSGAFNVLLQGRYLYLYSAFGRDNNALFS